MEASKDTLNRIFEFNGRETKWEEILMQKKYVKI